MSEPIYCVNHPNVETYLRCNRCGSPICVKCAMRTEVGYRCRACINRQQQVFYADFRPVHYLIAAAVALPLGLAAGSIVPNLGWFAIFLGPLCGVGIAEAVHWAIRRRRGPYTWLVVAGCILVGELPTILLSLFPLAISLPALAQNPASGVASGLFFGALSLVWGIVYLIGAIGAAVARLRPSRRR